MDSKTESNSEVDVNSDAVQSQTLIAISKEKLRQSHNNSKCDKDESLTSTFMKVSHSKDTELDYHFQINGTSIGKPDA